MSRTTCSYDRNLVSIVVAVSVIACSLFALSNLQEVRAENSTFITYENPGLGFSILRPSGWSVDDSFVEVSGNVKFSPPNSTTPAVYVRTSKPTPYLDIETMTVKNKTLDQLVQDFRTNISNPIPNTFGLQPKIIRQNKVIVSGNPGWKTDVMISNCSDNQCSPYTYGSSVLTIANGQLYFLEYEDKPLKVPESLPIANKMLDSFRMIPVEPNLKDQNMMANVSSQETNKPPQINNTNNTSLPSNNTLGYSDLFDRTTNPRTFTQEEQAAIDSKCNSLKDNYSSLPTEDRYWFLSNC